MVERDQDGVPIWYLTEAEATAFRRAGYFDSTPLTFVKEPPMPTSKHDDPTPDEVDEQAAANALPPEPDADDPVTGPVDDAWRRPEPADEPKGYREATQKEHDEAQAANTKAAEASQAASLDKK